MRKAIIIYATFPNMESAKDIVKSLLEKNLIGCANLREHKAMYVWKGHIEEEDEVGAILKTTDDRWEMVKEFINKVHPYETPAILKIDVSDANKGFLDWIFDVVK